MTLYLDIGNTWIKYQLERPGLAPQQGRVESLNDIDEPVDKLVFASVRTKQATRALLSSFLARGVPCYEAYVSSSAELSCDYDTPATLGVDRWLAALAAQQRFGDCIVADAGTAFTVDWVSGGRYRGGVIVQGLQQSVNNLLSGTHLVGEVSFDGLPCVPTNTAHAVGLGAMAQAEGLIAGLRVRWQTDAPLVITGGDAPSLIRFMDGRAEYCPNLVIEGLKKASLREVE